MSKVRNEVEEIHPSRWKGVKNQKLCFEGVGVESGMMAKKAGVRDIKFGAA